MNQLKEAILRGDTIGQIDDKLSVIDITSFYIEFYSTYCLSGDINFIDALYIKLNSLNKFKKQNDKFYTLCNEINMLLYKNYKENNTYNKFISKYNSLQINQLEVILQTFNLDRIKEPSYMVNIKNIVSPNMYKILMHLKHEKSKTHIIQLINYLLNETRLVVNAINIESMFSTVKMSLSNKKDIVWYIWYILLYEDDFHKDFKSLINLNFNLFCINFQKTNRINRKNILIYLFIIGASSNINKYIKNTYDVQHNTEEDYDYLKIITYSDTNLTEQIEKEKQMYNEIFEAECKN
jgi:hypothetical protein